MNLNINVSLDFTLPYAAAAILQIEAATIAGGVQTVQSSSLTLSPPAEMELFADFYGNPCRSLTLPQGNIHLDYEARIKLTDFRAPPLPPAETDMLRLPPETLLYTLPSRYCPSDRLLKMAYDTFGALAPGFPQVQALCSWIYEHIAYQYGTSDAMTTACDTAIERVGVCRDFAHLAIAFCRALNIPARYVSGYCLSLEPPDFHAYFEAYLEGRWIAFDATAPQPRRALVQVAVGRDAADCAWSTFYGAGTTTAMTVDVKEAPPD